MTTSITLRGTKGTALSYTEVDDNFSNLKTTADAAKTTADAAAVAGAIGSSGLTMATGKLLGRTSASTGAVEEITAPTGTVVGTSDTQTLTNKRVSPRVVAASATSGTITSNGDTTDVYIAEGLTGTITLAKPSGTPVDGQRLMIRLKDNGTARSIGWTTSAGAFRAVGITLPTTTVLGKVTYVGCVYNSTDNYWDAVAVVTQA